MVSAKFLCQILLRRISDATNMVTYHAVTIEKSTKKSSLIQFLVIKMVLGLLKWFKETSLYERKKEIIIKTLTLLAKKVLIKQKGRVRIKEKLILWISSSKRTSFQRRKLVERWSFLSIYEIDDLLRSGKDDISVLKKDKQQRKTIRWYFIYHGVSCFLITERFLFSIFWRWKMRGFFEPKSWGEYDIYWLLKSSCFEPFGNEKHGLCWAKKLMERWYLLLTEKFLFSNCCEWEMRSFIQPKSWWKDNIFFIFLSFLWYSRTW